ncbi:hypothetical protein NDU88_001145 [Pleurodeles waltl]|uniref:Target of rapamycin complex subunit lst8 n=1 Tax=Pleurodeles waltl TaxID=8319 RepID=A0AAV7LXR4_PLEWA|nr:hypothetical protein NDU88_001145 [Pleurodeles waltl]
MVSPGQWMPLTVEQKEEIQLSREGKVDHAMWRREERKLELQSDSDALVPRCYDDTVVNPSFCVSLRQANRRELNRERRYGSRRNRSLSEPEGGPQCGGCCGICTRTVQHQDSQVNSLEITPDRSMIAAAGYQHIRMYDLNSNNPNPVINYDGVSKNITSVGFHEDGRWMYTGGEDCMARIWDLRSRNLQCQRIFQVNAPINCVCLHPNQAELIVGDQSGAIHIWDLKTDHNEQLIPEPEVSINSVHIDPDASYMAAVNSSGNCYVWNLTGGIGEEVTQLIPKTKIPAHKRYALQCRFSPDSTLLATCSADQTCKIWRTSNFSLMTELSIKSNNPGETSRGWMWDCAFSGDSQYIVTASSDNLARLWCVETGEIKREYSGHQKAIACLAFNDSVLG